MKRSYDETITTLFEILAQANAADSDQKEDWQEPCDANQGGFFGNVMDAIRRIAGDKIVDHWTETSEIELLYAKRNSKKRFQHLLDEAGPLGQMLRGAMQCHGCTADLYDEDGDSESLFPGIGSFDQNWDVWEEVKDLIRFEDLHQFIIECEAFMDEATSVITKIDFGGWNQLGTDFVLSRNGHGAGFFDRSDDVYGEDVQNALQKRAEVWGTHCMEGQRNADGELTEISFHN